MYEYVLNHIYPDEETSRTATLSSFISARYESDDISSCMLLQPSTASVKRAFSLLKLILSKPNMMHDLIQITLMLQYNRRESKQELNEEEHNDDSSESTMRRLLLEDLTI